MSPSNIAILILSILVVVLFFLNRSKLDTICKIESKNRNLEAENGKLSGLIRDAQAAATQAIDTSDDLKHRCTVQAQENQTLGQTINLLKWKCEDTQRERDEAIEALKQHVDNLNAILSSNLSSMPWLAGMMADFLTYDLEVEAKKLDWGHNIQRKKKVASIREIRADARQRIEVAKIATYQLEYLRALYPAIDDVLDIDYEELDYSKNVFDTDPVRRYLTKEEWECLSPIEKDQLALDRYVQSRSKSSWQIGRDYELSVCYEYIKKGYSVTTFGSYMGLEDLGRDLIAQKIGTTLVIQCKYWSKHKTIHEKHIFQLYGTVVCYKIEHPQIAKEVHGLFVTNTKLSEMARKVSDILGITVVENHPAVDFPRIKCNIGKDGFGETKIYHLPMDAQYDATQIKLPGEFYAYTVAEAVERGFRRAYHWHGNK